MRILTRAFLNSLLAVRLSVLLVRSKRNDRHALQSVGCAKVFAMGEISGIIAQFQGTDPIQGDAALFKLLDGGDSAEQALFDMAPIYPAIRQRQRRWLKFVATRGDKVVGRLGAILEDSEKIFSRSVAAFLFAGTLHTKTAKIVTYDLLRTGFDRNDHPTEKFNSKPLHFADIFEAWGYAGGSAFELWLPVTKSAYVWEKLRTFAFRAACGSFARSNVEDGQIVQKLLTHTVGDNGLEPISEDSGVPLSTRAIQDNSAWFEVFFGVDSWARGPVVDELLSSWSCHRHWRVRLFAAGLLQSFRFGRVVGPMSNWLSREEAYPVDSGGSTCSVVLSGGNCAATRTPFDGRRPFACPIPEGVC